MGSLMSARRCSVDDLGHFSRMVTARHSVDGHGYCSRMVLAMT